MKIVEEYKGYRIAGLEDFAMVKIMGPGSGPIPSALEGHWTKLGIAKQAIDNHLSSLVTNKKKRTTKDDKEKSTSSG